MPARRGRPAKASSPASGITLEIGGKTAAAETLTREQQLEAENAALRAQIAAKPARGAAAEYPEPTTPRAVAETVAAQPDMLRDLHHMMVQRIPGTVTQEKPFGDGVLIKARDGRTDLYKMRSEFGSTAEEQSEARNHYIKLGRLAKQVYGYPLQYRKGQPLNDDQIDKILRPALDYLQDAGLVNW